MDQKPGMNPKTCAVILLAVTILGLLFVAYVVITVSLLSR